MAAPLTHDDVQARLSKLVRAALFLRIGVACLLHFAFDEAFFAGDQGTYDWCGREIVSYWRGDRATLPGLVRPAAGGYYYPTGYYYIVAVIYYLIGPWSLLPKLLNSFVGSRTVTLTYRLARSLTGSDEVALRTAAYTAYFPSLVLWSSLNLRDVWIVFLILYMCVKATELQERFSIGTLVALVASSLAITLFRDYIFVAIAGPMLVSFLARRRGHIGRNAFIGMLLALALIYLDQSRGARTKMRAPDLLSLQEYRTHTGFGGSKVEESADISTPIRALLFLPKGMTYFLLAPFPWNVGSARQVITLPETLFFYSLLPAIVIGTLSLIRYRLSDSMMILMITGGLTLGYSLGQANIGTAYRYRAQVLPFYLLFAAVGRGMQRDRQATTAQLQAARTTPALATG
jgi:hypothetical protein